MKRYLLRREWHLPETSEPVQDKGCVAAYKMLLPFYPGIDVGIDALVSGDIGAVGESIANDKGPRLGRPYSLYNPCGGSIVVSDGTIRMRGPDPDRLLYDVLRAVQRYSANNHAMKIITP
jgi:hypothetical protein